MSPSLFLHACLLVQPHGSLAFHLSPLIAHTTFQCLVSSCLSILGLPWHLFSSFHTYDHTHKRFRLRHFLISYFPHLWPHKTLPWRLFSLSLAVYLSLSCLAHAHLAKLVCPKGYVTSKQLSVTQTPYNLAAQTLFLEFFQHLGRLT